MTDRLTFICIIPIIDVDLFTPSMEFQLTNPASPSFPGNVFKKNKAVSSTFGLLFQRKLILHGRGDSQSSEPKSLLANFHHSWWRSLSLKATRTPMCFVQSMTQKERKPLLLPSWSKTMKEWAQFFFRHQQINIKTPSFTGTLWETRNMPRETSLYSSSLPLLPCTWANITPNNSFPS